MSKHDAEIRFEVAQTTDEANAAKEKFEIGEINGIHFSPATRGYGVDTSGVRDWLSTLETKYGEEMTMEILPDHSVKVYRPL